MIEEYYRDKEIADLLGISLQRLRNKLNEGAPYWLCLKSPRSKSAKDQM